MALEAKLVQKLSQSLLMTPQLQQAIKLLQLGRLEYIEAIQQELLENPILEELKEEDPESRRDAPSEDSSDSSDETKIETLDKDPKDLKQNDSPVDWEDYLERFTDSRGMSTPKGFIDFEDRQPIEANLTRPETLREHLADQLRMAETEEGDHPIILQILGNIDKNGYLECSYEELAELSGSTVDDVTRVVQLFRELDPPGVCARNLGECLLAQLEAMGRGESLAARIIDKHLELLERRKYDSIAKEESVEVEEVYDAVKSIRLLEPRPGRPFADDDTRYITPDIYVYKVGGEYVISLNEEGLPKLRVSPYYLDVLKQAASEQSEEKVYLNEKLKSASWLIKSIHQRQNTIYRVTESIVKFQRPFLENGIEHLKPLVLKNVADDIDMHESTVSRVTTNKYVHTPQGVFELKYFFTTGIQAGSGEVSSSSVKEKIRNIIASEDPKKPISDQKIVEMLDEQNVQIARRTVAKYREGLGILSSSKRKKLF